MVIWLPKLLKEKGVIDTEMPHIHGFLRPEDGLLTILELIFSEINLLLYTIRLLYYSKKLAKSSKILCNIQKF